MNVPVLMASIRLVEVSIDWRTFLWFILISKLLGIQPNVRFLHFSTVIGPRIFKNYIYSAKVILQTFDKVELSRKKTYRKEARSCAVWGGGVKYRNRMKKTRQ